MARKFRIMGVIQRNERRLTIESLITKSVISGALTCSSSICPQGVAFYKVNGSESIRVTSASKLKRSAAVAKVEGVSFYTPEPTLAHTHTEVRLESPVEEVARV